MGQIRLILLVWCLSAPTPLYADCAQKVQPIEKGEVAPCSGFVFSDAAEKEAAKAKDDAQFYKELGDKLTRRSVLQTKENSILSERLELYMNQSSVLAKQTAQHDNTDGLFRLGYFTLGAVLTAIIVSNVNR